MSIDQLVKDLGCETIEEARDLLDYNEKQQKYKWIPRLVWLTVCIFLIGLISVFSGCEETCESMI